MSRCPSCGVEWPDDRDECPACGREKPGHRPHHPGYIPGGTHPLRMPVAMKLFAILLVMWLVLTIILLAHYTR